MQTLSNPSHGNIPDYWSVPLGSYNNEVCFVTKDGVVAAPRLLIRTIFPDFDSLQCPGCVLSHERVTILVKMSDPGTSSQPLEASPPTIQANWQLSYSCHQLGALKTNRMMTRKKVMKME